MNVFIPCLNVDSGNTQSGSGIQIVSANSVASGAVSLAGTQIPFAIGETVFYINPVTAIISFAINFQFWADLFGLGETRIDREKATIQQVLTPILQYLNVAYGVPITDFHALDFPSDGVQKMFALRPDIAALVPGLLSTAPIVAQDIFPGAAPTTGQEERVVNQLLANAAFNQWPAPVAQGVWDGLVAAAQPSCSQDVNRWLKNPLITRAAAIGGALLRYIPLSTLVDMAVNHHVGDPLVENLALLWASNPQLVSNVGEVTGLPWQHIYTDGTWALPPYGDNLGNVIPLLQRDHIVPIVASITIQNPRYPDFVAQAPTPIPSPVPQPPVSPPSTQPPTAPPGTQPTQAVPIQPFFPNPPPNVVEIPPAGQQPQYTQEQLAFACHISMLLYAGSQLTPQEQAWYDNPNNQPILNLQINNPQCKTPLVRPPVAQTPSTPGPSVNPSQPGQFTQTELDMACHVSRLLYGNSVLSADEQRWYNDPANIDLLTLQLNNPACKIPLVRTTPDAPAIPSQESCPPINVIPGQTVPQGPGQVFPIPTPQGPGTQPGQNEPCPPDCQHQINEVKQRQEECCDELHTNVVPRIENLETWISHVWRHVPEPPIVLPHPYPIPPVDTVPGTDIPVPVPDIPVPPTQPASPLPDKITCDIIVQCVVLHCKEINAVLEACKKADPRSDCKEGIEKWGKWAECWLDTYTPLPAPNRGYAENIITSGQLNARLKAVWGGQAPGSLGVVQQGMSARIKALWQGDYSQLGKSFFPYEGGPGFVFEDVHA